MEKYTHDTKDCYLAYFGFIDYKREKNQKNHRMKKSHI